MGQNSSDNSYKKSYTADYTKSYKSGHGISEPPATEEKLSKDSVLAEGGRRTSPPEAKVIDKTKSVEIKKTTAREKPVVEKEAESKAVTPIEPKVEEIRNKTVEPKPQIIIDISTQQTKTPKEQLPPLFDLEGIFNKKQKNADPETIKYPVKHLHGTTYLDVFSGREINEERARDLLRTAGFTPKTTSGILPIFLSILALFFFKYYGLGLLIFTGFWLYKKDSTTYTKFTGMEKLSIFMPASKYEMMVYKFQAIICFIILVVCVVWISA